METITINSVDYPSYATVEQADEYLGGSINAETWQDETDEVRKGRALITASRWIDSVAWAGTKVNDAQLLEWPRTDVTDISELVVPPIIVLATIELANLLIEEPELRSVLADPAIKRMKAGSVELEYFRGATVQTLTAFPKLIMDLIRHLLAGDASTGLGGSRAYGTNYCSHFHGPFTLNGGL